MSVDSSAPTTVEAMEVPDPQVAPKARRRRFSAAYKKRILAQYDVLPRGERSALLRREGLYSSLVGKWKSQAAEASSSADEGRRPGPKPNPQAREVARLQR